MMEVYFLILLKLFQWSDCTFRVFWSFGAWITHSHTLQKYRATTNIFISFYTKFKYCFPVITHQGSISAEWKTLHNSSSRSHTQFMRTEVRTYNKAYWC